MNNYLTEDAINILKEEIENRKIIIRKQINEDLKEARAHGDLSENFEYKAAKRERARNESRIRFLERMIKTAIIIKDTTASNEVGLNKYVTVKFLEDNYVQELYIVTTVEADPLEELALNHHLENLYLNIELAILLKLIRLKALIGLKFWILRKQLR